MQHRAYGFDSKPASIRSVVAFLFLVFALPAAGQAQGSFETAEILFTRAVLAYDEGRYAEATRELLQAHELDPGHIDVIYYLGLSYNAQGDFDQAERYLRRGLERAPKNSDLRYQLGISLYGQKKFDGALTEFLAVYRPEPRKDNVGYYIGLCYYQKKDYETAVGYFRKNVSTQAKTRQLNQYSLGLALRALGREKEAIAELTEAVKIEPAAPIVGATQQLLTVLQERAEDKRLRLQVTLNGQYDSNAAGDTDAKRSYGNLINVRADYTFYRAGPWESSVTYSALQTLNYNAHAFDLSDHLLGVNFYYKTHLAEMPANVGLQLSNDILLLGGEKFLQRPTGTLSFTVQEDSSNFTTALFRAQYKGFFHHQDYSSIDRRDAANELVGLVHFVRFGGGRHQVNFGYHFDREDAGGKEWSYTGHKAVAGLLLSLPWEIRGAVNAEYHARFYGGQSTFNRHRNDDEAIVLAALSKEIAPKLTLILQHLWDRNYSTAKEFKVTRNVTSLGVTWRY
jgi:tetratricopeptide (TPR) repeat protein